MPCKIQFVNLYLLNVKMIRLKVDVPYTGLNQKWSAAKVEATGNHIVLNRKLFTSFGRKFYCNSSSIFSLTLIYIKRLKTQ